MTNKINIKVWKEFIKENNLETLNWYWAKLSNKSKSSIIERALIVSCNQIGSQERIEAEPINCFDDRTKAAFDYGDIYFVDLDMSYDDIEHFKSDYWAALLSGQLCDKKIVEWSKIFKMSDLENLTFEKRMVIRVIKN